MSDLIGEKFKLLCDQLTHKEDCIISQAISDYLGHNDWIREKIKNEGFWQVSYNRPKEKTLVFDGVPILWLHDPEMVETGDPYKIRYEQKYKVLVKVGEK